jgi:hypothetical protein
MVERRIELDRRYHRKAKIRKLKAKLASGVSGADREKVLYKIKRLSPAWTEESQTPAAASAPKEPKAAAEPKPKKPAGPPKPKKA